MSSLIGKYEVITVKQSSDYMALEDTPTRRLALSVLPSKTTQTTFEGSTLLKVPGSGLGGNLL